MYNLSNNSIPGTAYHSLHLHALDNHQRLVFPHFIALLDFNPQHFTRHGRQYAVRHILHAQRLLGPFRHGELEAMLLALREKGEAICIANERRAETSMWVERREDV